MVRRNPVPVVGDLGIAVRLWLAGRAQVHEDDLITPLEPEPRVEVARVGEPGDPVGPVAELAAAGLRELERVVERPKRVAVRPISIRSPWTAELTKLISEMYLVTARPLPSCRMA